MVEDLSLLAAGTNLSAPSGSSSSATAIPVAADGNKPKYIRVSVASGSVHFAIGTSAIAATTSWPIISISDSQIIAVGGHTHYAVWGIGGAVTTVVTPLENQK